MVCLAPYPFPLLRTVTGLSSVEPALVHLPGSRMDM